jgi:ubiquinone/menaquinone biosynthesis C-methylase UbiE
MDSVEDKHKYWQLKLFELKLKKKQKLHELLKILGQIEGKKCLLITCGDNDGALNWHFKKAGGDWSWADAEKDSADEIAKITSDPVFVFDKKNQRLDYISSSFDIVLTIDVHEHLQNTKSFNQELARIVKRHGSVIVTTPGGDNKKIVNVLKNFLGMTTTHYGHYVDGYSIEEIKEQMKSVHLIPTQTGSYSRFFTELLELGINIIYVKILSKRMNIEVEEGQIAPQNKDQLQAIRKTYRVYTFVYPIMWLISKLDFFFKFSTGYAVIVSSRKD